MLNTEHQIGDKQHGNSYPVCVGKRWPGRNDATDKNRSLGFSPGNFAPHHPKDTAFFNRRKLG
jgi:hypothetical protein